MQPTPLPQPVELPEDGRLYQHYRGDCFRIVSCALSSEDSATWKVIYRSLSTGKVWERPLDKFTDEVRWPDGVHRDRYMQAAALPAALRAAVPVATEQE